MLTVFFVCTIHKGCAEGGESPSAPRNQIQDSEVEVEVWYLRCNWSVLFLFNEKSGKRAYSCAWQGFLRFSARLTPRRRAPEPVAIATAVSFERGRIMAWTGDGIGRQTERAVVCVEVDNSESEASVKGEKVTV